MNQLSFALAVESVSCPKPGMLGERVCIERVSQPAIAHHASFIGALGTVTRYIKRRRVSVVTLDDGRVRECLPANLKKL